ncbi:hypothetical protein AOR01nite_20180 [Acetobacter orleanensis]|uniref:Type II secretion system protein GspC N-terminal domain-containing protein n=2 Tax=Acetobacter orleanensis TaxID=104099 RepID=A0A4Y3TKM3_9PROT|nr:hypothetical protein AOR01nite_20180 [Acetobacter orleanensis]
MGRKHGTWCVLGVGFLHAVTLQSALASPTPLDEKATQGDAAKTVLARPLFALDRRPDAAAMQAETTPVLTGIVHYAGQNGALFKAPGLPVGHLVRTGETVAGWTLVSISRESVTLERGGEKSIQRPDFQHRQGMSVAEPPSTASSSE